MKLPDITYGRASSPSGGPGPQVAVRAAAERQQIVNAGFKAAEEVGTAYRDFELRKHDAEYQNEMSDFRTKAATMKVATPAEIKALGLDDVIDTEGKEFIPKSEWYPVALERMMEKNKEKYASRIKSPKDRAKWTQEMDSHNNQILLRETKIAAEESARHLEQLKQVSYEESIRAEDYEGARSAAASMTDPVLRDKYMHEVDVTEEQTEVNFRMATEDLSQIERLVRDLGDPELQEDSVLSSPQKLANFNSAVAKRNSIETQNDRDKSDYEDALATRHLIGLTTGESDINAINRDASSLGVTHHSRLVNTARALSGGGVISNPATVTRYEGSLMMLEAGILPEGTNFEDTVRQLQKEVYNDAYVGEDGVTALNGDDAKSIMDRLIAVKEFPYKTVEYSDLQKDTYRLITGLEPGLVAQSLGNDPASATYVQALNDLRGFVVENGGTAAPLSEWRNKRLPIYVKRASEISLKQVNGDSPVDILARKGERVQYKETTQKIARLLKENQKNPVAIRQIQSAALRFDSWNNTFGGVYAD